MAVNDGAPDLLLCTTSGTCQCIWYNVMFCCWDSLLEESFEELVSIACISEVPCKDLGHLPA